MAMLTLWGMETYLKMNNETLFSDIVLPDGLIKERLVDNIMIKGNEFEVLYADPYFLKSVINHLFSTHHDTFNRWVSALNKEYNPIENYDRHEDFTENGTVNSTVSNTQTSSVTSTDKVNTYESGTLADHGQTVTGSNDSLNTSGSSGNNLSRVSHIHGNIGVTTNQQMLEAEIGLRRNYNIYDMIADVIVDNICIKVY